MTAAAAVTARTPCVSCGQPMELLTLAAHYGRTVDVDMCPACHLLWFDNLESVNLSGRGVLHLLKAMDRTHHQPHTPLPLELRCPRCAMRLTRSANLTSHGPTAHHECPRGHGAAQSFSLYLAEKGLVRPLYRPEIEQLRKRPDERQKFFCLNCGAPLDPREREACSFCSSPVKVLDVLPLMRAVDRQTGQLPAGATSAEPVRHRQFHCHYCGATVDPARERRCAACAMPVAVTDLTEALALIEPLVPAIEEGVATVEHRLRRLAESLDTAPKGLPPVRPPFGFGGHWWVKAGGALFVLGFGLLLVWSSR